METYTLGSNVQQKKTPIARRFLQRLVLGPQHATVVRNEIYADRGIPLIDDKDADDEGGASVPASA
jgi:hypothetical protein